MAMTIESIRDWHRKQARAKDVCGELRFPGPNESPFYRIPSEESKQHDAMADALDAHITQPAQAVDVGAWRACYGAIIQSLAVMARIGAPDSWPEDAIRRDPVMEEVCRIRQAIDTYGKLTRALAGEKAEGWRVPDETLVAVYNAVSRANITRDVKTPETKARIVRTALAPTPPTDGEE